MKLRPSILFLILTINLLILGFLARDKSLDIQLHEIYLIVSYLNIAFILSLLTSLITLIYLSLEIIGQPIKLRTGYWHCGLFIIGLLIFIIFSQPYPTELFDLNLRYSNYILGSIIMLLIGSILILISLIVFIFGLTKAFMSKQQ